MIAREKLQNTLLTALILLVTTAPAFAQGEDIPNKLVHLSKRIVDIIIAVAAILVAVGIAYKAVRGRRLIGHRNS